ncbi:hypothetical protein [Pacificibacter marinus]|uniref:hypothetical protein n=1 Tax=Pacificibacter marinus TaxID=658057 RepID=UPI00147F7446|nr:hypothetical protein [Pacificibacter marinus]
MIWASTVAEITMQDVLRVLNKSFEDKSGMVIGTWNLSRKTEAIKLLIFAHS